VSSLPAGGWTDFESGAEVIYPAFMVIPELARLASQAHARLNRAPWSPSRERQPERWDWPAQIKAATSPTALQAHFDELTSRDGWTTPLEPVAGWEQALTLRLHVRDLRHEKSHHDGSGGAVEIEYYQLGSSQSETDSGTEWEVQAGGGLRPLYRPAGTREGTEPLYDLSFTAGGQASYRAGQAATAANGSITVSRVTYAGLAHTFSGHPYFTVIVRRWKGRAEEQEIAYLTAPGALDLLIPHRKALALGLPLSADLLPADVPAVPAAVPAPPPGGGPVTTVIDSHIMLGMSHAERLDSAVVLPAIRRTLQDWGVLAPARLVTGRPDGLALWLEAKFGSKALRAGFASLRHEGVAGWHILPSSLLAQH
jgi:hypothetical protein